MLIKILSSFLFPIPLDGKKRRNKNAFGKKAFFEAGFLILPLHNSFEDVFLLFPLYPLIILSNVRLSAPKSDVGVFSKDNAGKGREDDSGNTGANKEINADNPGTETNVDAKTNNPGTIADNSSKGTNNLSIIIDDLGKIADNSDITADNLGIKTDADAKADNPGTLANNPGTRMDVNIKSKNPGIAANNKARVYAAFLFALYCAFFLLTSSFELVTASLLSFLLSSSSTTLRSKSILLCLVISVKRGAPFFRYSIDKMWRTSLNKISSEICMSW